MVFFSHTKVSAQIGAMWEPVTKDDQNKSIKLSNKESFLSDYKLSLEAIKSMLLRVVHMKHPLQERVDKAVTTKGEGKDIYAITIDYKKF